MKRLRKSRARRSSSRSSEKSLVDMARSLLRRAKTLQTRGSRNWVRNGPGDEAMARRYWDKASALRSIAQGFVSNAEYDQLLREVEQS